MSTFTHENTILPAFTEEEIPMTMQVGMVGTDGILIASDTLWMNTESNQTADIRHTTHASKIEIDNERGVAIGCARNMELAMAIAKEMISEMDSEQWEYPCFQAKKIGDRILSESKEHRRDFQCTIAISKPEPQLFQLHAGIFNLQKGTSCHQHARKVVAGDRVNAAVFWAERYYSSWRESLLPIRQLIPLAAHLVLSAGVLARGSIDGLEIVVCDSDGVRRLSGELISELVKRSADLDELISRSLLGGE